MVSFSKTRSQTGRWALQVGLLALVPTLAWSQGTYTTNFPLTENPISESGHWINGGTTGLDWTNVRTTPGMAFGTMPGNATGNSVYADSTAVLSGTWGPTQTVQATVSVISTPSSSVSAEVELRLRTTITAHSITGYEVNCSVRTGNGYLQIVRWNGPLGNFTYLPGGPAVQCVNGDVLKATISGSAITVYLNGVQMAQATDSTYTSGSPGIGFYLQGGTSALNSNFGFSSFTATDGSTASFTMSATPSSQTVTAGTNTTYTVNVSPAGGFTGAVGLSASGLPAGATASFNPTSITTSGSSTLTVSTPGSTAAASYPLTIKGTSGSLSQTAAVTLVVNSSTSGGTSTACDLNKDGSTNVVDAQLAINKYLGCTAGPNVASPAFSTQVITGALGGSCSATSGAFTVALSWTASTTPGVTYNVYRAATSGGYTTPLNSAPISGTSFSDCTVMPGQTYYFVIRSVDASGNQSANSTEVSVAVPSSL
jgi:hypothetical protein